MITFLEKFLKGAKNPPNELESMRDLTVLNMAQARYEAEPLLLDGFHGREKKIGI